MIFQDLFTLGMKRAVPNLCTPQGVILNLGAGNTNIPGTISFDLPEWNAETDNLPYADETVDSIYALHFLEHLSGANVIRILKECERVLRHRGLMTIVVPHRLGGLAYQDLDHKSFFNEETWRNLFDNPYYDKNREVKWKFKIHFNLIAGLNERNLALFTQLVKQY